MACKVIWTEEARNAFRQIISYLEQNFSEKEIIRFIEHTGKKIAFLNPIRECTDVLKKQIIFITQIFFAEFFSSTG
jgi:hypothetical protein